MVSKVVFVVILAVVSWTSAFEVHIKYDNQINEAIGKLDHASEQSELKENALTTRFDDSSNILKYIHKAFEAQRAGAKALRKVVMTAQSVIFTPLRSAYALADNVENQVKNRIDEARMNIEDQIREANTRDSKVVECAVQSAEPFQEVAEKLYQNTKRCLTDRIDSMVRSETNIVEQSLFAIDIMTNADLIIANCVEGVNDKPNLREVVKASACLAKVGKDLALVPVKIDMEIANIYATVQTFGPVVSACASTKGAIAGKDMAVVAYNVGRCLVTKNE